MSNQSKTAAIETFLASYKVKDVETRIALFAEGIVFEDPVGTPPIVGRKAMNDYFVATVASGWAPARKKTSVSRTGRLWCPTAMPSSTSG